MNGLRSKRRYFQLLPAVVDVGLLQAHTRVVPPPGYQALLWRDAASCSSVALPVVSDFVEETRSDDLQASAGCSVVILIFVFD